MKFTDLIMNTTNKPYHFKCVTVGDVKKVHRIMKMMMMYVVNEWVVNGCRER